MKKTLIIILSVSVVIICALVYFISRIPEMEPVRVSKRISFPHTPDELFFKSEVWGMTYDHKIIALSVNGDKEIESDPEKDYIFNGVNTLFYKVKQDSLILYTPSKASIPAHFDSNITIQQIELDNVSMMNLLKEKEYLKQGLTVFE